jgi:hypothetical protein
MIGFWVVDLLIPAKPQTLQVKTPSGTWTIDKAAFYIKSVDAIAQGKSAETYAIEHPVSMSDGAAKCDAALAEMIPLMLGASYLTGLSVTAKRSLPHSDITLMQPGDHWPREHDFRENTTVPRLGVQRTNYFLPQRWTQLANLRAAPRCGAKTRAGGACQCPAIRDRKRCRLHGGRSPGAPKGAR